jgi:hypothetical protein
MAFERVPPYDYYRNNQHTLGSIHDTIRDLVESQPKTIVAKSGQSCEVLKDGHPTNSDASFETGARQLIQLETFYQERCRTSEAARLMKLGVGEEDATQRAQETYSPPSAGLFKESEFVELQQLIKLSHIFLVDDQNMVRIASTHVQLPHDEFSYRRISITKCDSVPIDARSELFTSTNADLVIPHFITRAEDKFAIWHVLYDRMTTPEQLDKVVAEIFRPFLQTGWQSSVAASVESIREQFKRIRETDQFHKQTGYGLLHSPRRELDKIQTRLSALQA